MSEVGSQTPRYDAVSQLARVYTPRFQAPDPGRTLRGNADEVTFVERGGLPFLEGDGLQVIRKCLSNERGFTGGKKFFSKAF